MVTSIVNQIHPIVSVGWLALQHDHCNIGQLGLAVQYSLKSGM